MGWDAHATYFNKRHVGLILHNERYIIANPKLRVAFKNASRKVKRKTGAVDGFLSIGGLDCSACAHALEWATGMYCWLEEGYSPAEVEGFYRIADWDSEVINNRGDNRWAVESAKAFLSVCVRHKLGITFTW